MECLQRGAGYRHNPVVRVQAIESLQRLAPSEGLPWIRAALHDDHPSVRFAACVAVGSLRDAVASETVERGLADADPNVRLAAVFARHRLGDASRTGELADGLLLHADPLVRRNAALLLGLLGEPGAVKILARAMKDADDGVRNHALEAMAGLGVEEAARQLCFLANSGYGSQELFALNALDRTRDARYAEVYRLKLQRAAHVETRLAAARALAHLGDFSGLDLARSALRRSPSQPVDPEDSVQDHQLRVKSLAALTLGAIGDPAAVDALVEMMEGDDDPRLQVSAAGAVLEIVDRHRSLSRAIGDFPDPQPR